MVWHFFFITSQQQMAYPMVKKKKKLKSLTFQIINKTRLPNLSIITQHNIERPDNKNHQEISRISRLKKIKTHVSQITSHVLRKHKTDPER